MRSTVNPSWFQRFSFAAVPVAVCSAMAGARPPQPPAVTNADALIPWIRAAAVGRADFVGIGDSNQLQQGHGWDHGMTKALAERFGLYATSLIAPGENGGVGAGTGFGYGVVGAGAPYQATGAPSWLNERMASNVAMFPFNYMFLPDGQTAGAFNIYGLYLDQTSAVGVNGALRFTLIHGAFPSAGNAGVFRLFVRNPNPPYQPYAETNLQGNGFGTPYGILTAPIFLPAAPRNTSLYFRLGRIEENVVGPFMLYYMRVENQQTIAGASHHTLYAFGGRTAFDMALALNAADDSYLSLFFSNVRALQGPDARVLILSMYLDDDYVTQALEADGKAARLIQVTAISLAALDPASEAGKKLVAEAGRGVASDLLRLHIEDLKARAGITVNETLWRQISGSSTP